MQLSWGSGREKRTALQCIDLHVMSAAQTQRKLSNTELLILPLATRVLLWCTCRPEEFLIRAGTTTANSSSHLHVAEFDMVMALMLGVIIAKIELALTSETAFIPAN